MAAGSKAALAATWEALDFQFSNDDVPAQQLLNDLMSGTIITTTNTDKMFEFVRNCQSAMNLIHLNDPTMAILNSKQTIDTITKRLDYTLRMKWIEYRNDHKHDSNTQLFPRFFKWIKKMTKVYADPLSKSSTTNTIPTARQPTITRNTSMPSSWTENVQEDT